MTVAVSGLCVLLGVARCAEASVWLESSPSPQSWNNAYSWSGFPGGVPASVSQIADLSQTDITTNMTIEQSSHDRNIGGMLLGDAAGNQTYTIDFAAGDEAKRLIFGALSGDSMLRFGGTETNGSHVIRGIIQLDTNLAITGNAAVSHVGANLELGYVDGMSRTITYNGQINWAVRTDWAGEARPGLLFYSSNSCARLVVNNGLLLSRHSLAIELGASPDSFVADSLTLNGGVVGVETGAAMIVEANRGVTLGIRGGVLWVTNAAQAIVVNSVISGSGKLCSVGVPGSRGTNILNAANTYAGETVIRDSILSIGTNGSIRQSPVVLVYSNATLKLGQTNALAGTSDVCLFSNGGGGACGMLNLDYAGEQVISNLFVDGEGKASGTYGSSVCGPVDHTNDNWFAGAGVLRVHGGGQTRTLCVFAGTGGGVSPDGPVGVGDGATPIEASAGSGYVFANWSVEAGIATFGNSNLASTTVQIAAPASIRANFTALAIVASTASVVVAEGGTNSFLLKLSTQPTGDVTVAVAHAGGDSNIVVFAGESLVFTTNNWDTYQPVILGADVDNDDVSVPATIACSSPGLVTVSVSARVSEAGAVGYSVVTDSTYVVHIFTNAGTGAFIAPQGVTNVEVLVVGGGGGGGSGGNGVGTGAGGGGGAGGVIHTTMQVSTGTGYAVVIGGGGAGGGRERFGAGSSSAFGAFVAMGGGQGITDSDGATGGSGAGGFGKGYQGGAAMQPGSASGGRGYAGGAGAGSTNPAVASNGGGGGGAGGVGGDAGNNGGSGGSGYACAISGVMSSYAGGGGGGGWTNVLGAGGWTNAPGGTATAGGGKGGEAGKELGDLSARGAVGTPGTGGGGGGGGYHGSFQTGYGGAGGSGIVIVRYPAVDADGDQMPDQWESLYLGGTNAMPSGDLDGDGVGNLAEFLAGTLANDPTSYLGITAITGSPAVVVWQSVAGKTYALQASTNLMTGFNLDVATGIPATAPLNSHTGVMHGAVQMFYRIKLE